MDESALSLIGHKGTDTPARVAHVRFTHAELMSESLESSTLLTVDVTSMEQRWFS